MPWIMANSGLRVDLPRPSPDQINIHDIAHHLSMINRFTGAVSQPYSVAEHSLWVSSFLETNGAGPELAYQGLMHDATEAYLGDVNSPLKSLLPEYRLIEQGFWEVIADKFSLPYHLPPEVKLADKQAYLVERDTFMPWNSDLLSEGVNINPTPPVSLGQRVAKEEFLRRFFYLRRLIDENNYKRESGRTVPKLVAVAGIA